LQTNDPNIFAAGDVAQVYDPRSGRSVLDSLWGPARQQGYAAGLNMAGKPFAIELLFNVTRLRLTTTIIGTVDAAGMTTQGIALATAKPGELPDCMIAQTGDVITPLLVEKTLLQLSR
jgi:NADPH-dependent 2,4-dienoyl-CoA reductase/sulfur reductase-like enzyme